MWLRGGSSPTKLSLDDFQRQVAAGNVADASLMTTTTSSPAS